VKVKHGICAHTLWKLLEDLCVLHDKLSFCTGLVLIISYIIVVYYQVLYDLKIVDHPEPFLKLVHQGMILGADNEKMSKSRGNVVNPDDIVQEYGADALRVKRIVLWCLLRWCTAYGVSLSVCRTVFS
jgi:hypothetical protein